MNTHDGIYNEINEIMGWAENIQKRLGKEHFKFDLSKKYVIEDHFISMVFFNIDCDIPSKDVKRVIREEADRYKNGRLYFMVYNDIKGILMLLFYSFFLYDKDLENSENCEILKPL